MPDANGAELVWISGIDLYLNLTTEQLGSQDPRCSPLSTDCFENHVVTMYNN
jgi:hypothetical protein